MVVVAVLGVAETEGLVPFQTCLLPVFEPFEFLTGTHEELHLHLFELAHAENKLTGHNLVAESLANLCDAERYAHTSGFLNIEIVLHKYAPVLSPDGGIRSWHRRR